MEREMQDKCCFKNKRSLLGIFVYRLHEKAFNNELDGKTLTNFYRIDVTKGDTMFA